MITGCPHETWVYCHVTSSGVLEICVEPFSQVSELWDQVGPGEEKGGEDMQRRLTGYGINRAYFTPKVPTVIFWKSSLATNANPSSSKHLGNPLAESEHDHNKRVPRELLKRICNHQAGKSSLDLFHPDRVNAIWLFFPPLFSRTLSYRASLSQENEDIFSTHLPSP